MVLPSSLMSLQKAITNPSKEDLVLASRQVSFQTSAPPKVLLSRVMLWVSATVMWQSRIHMLSGAHHSWCPWNLFCDGMTEPHLPDSLSFCTVGRVLPAQESFGNKPVVFHGGQVWGTAKHAWCSQPVHGRPFHLINLLLIGMAQVLNAPQWTGSGSCKHMASIIPWMS